MKDEERLIFIKQETGKGKRKWHVQSICVQAKKSSLQKNGTNVQNMKKQLFSVACLSQDTLHRWMQGVNGAAHNNSLKCSVWCNCQRWKLQKCTTIFQKTYKMWQKATATSFEMPSFSKKERASCCYFAEEVKKQRRPKRCNKFLCRCAFCHPGNNLTNPLWESSCPSSNVPLLCGGGHISRVDVI